MKDSEREILRVNLPKLLELITASEIFLSCVSSRNTLTRSDIETVRAQKHEGNISQVSKLLDLLLTRTDGFETLIYALQSTRQTDALALLRPGEGASSPLLESSRTLNTSSNVSETTLGVYPSVLPTVSSTPAAKALTADYIVGEGAVTIPRIVIVVDDSDIGHAFLQDLRNLARRLGISAKERKQLLENDDEPLDKFEAVLEAWKKTFSSEARLESLLEVIEKCNAKAIADALREKFGV